MTKHADNNKVNQSAQLDLFQDNLEALNECPHCHTDLPCLRVGCTQAQEMIKRLDRKVQNLLRDARTYGTKTAEARYYKDKARKIVIEQLENLLMAHRIDYSPVKIVHIREDGNIEEHIAHIHVDFLEDPTDEIAQRYSLIKHLQTLLLFDLITS